MVNEDSHVLSRSTDLHSSFVQRTPSRTAGEVVPKRKALIERKTPLVLALGAEYSRSYAKGPRSLEVDRITLHDAFQQKLNAHDQLVQ